MPILSQLHGIHLMESRFLLLWKMLQILSLKCLQNRQKRHMRNMSMSITIMTASVAADIIMMTMKSMSTIITTMTTSAAIMIMTTSMNIIITTMTASAAIMTMTMNIIIMKDITMQMEELNSCIRQTVPQIIPYLAC